MTEKITPLFIKNIKKAGKYDDGNGLRLYVKKSLNKSWVFRFSIHGKRHEMGIGAFPDISLKDARNKAHDEGRWVREAATAFAAKQAARKSVNQAS